MKTLKIKVELDLKEGKKEIEMEHKDDYEIDDCELDKVIMLNLCNGETYTGIFRGMDGKDVMLGSMSGGNTIGLSMSVVDDYFEEIKD